MQVAKYWRNRKLRYRLEGPARQEARALVPPRADKVAAQNGRAARKRQPVRLQQ